MEKTPLIFASIFRCYHTSSFTFTAVAILKTLYRAVCSQSSSLQSKKEKKGRGKWEERCTLLLLGLSVWRISNSFKTLSSSHRTPLVSTLTSKRDFFSKWKLRRFLLVRALERKNLEKENLGRDLRRQDRREKSFFFATIIMYQRTCI